MQCFAAESRRFGYNLWPKFGQFGPILMRSLLLRQSAGRAPAGRITKTCNLQCCQLWLFIAKWAIFRPCDLAIFGKNVGYSQLFGLFLGKVWLFRLFYNKLAIFRLWELATLQHCMSDIFCWWRTQ